MYTLQQLAETVGAKTQGNSEAEITGVRPFEQAQPGDIALAEHAKYKANLSATQASAVIVEDGFESTVKPLLIATNPRAAFARILYLYHTNPYVDSGIADSAAIHDSCHIARSVSIHPFVSVGEESVIESEVTLYPGVTIGARCHIGTGSSIHPNVTIYPDTRIGKRAILHSGCVIGADGFGFVVDQQRQIKIPQTGNVIIHDDVEIGANTCIDCATFGSTLIESGVKIDNHVQIGHNCQIGENTVICGFCGISGSITIGKNCILAGNVGIRDHVNIGDNVMILARTSVAKDIASDSVVSGMFQLNRRDDFRLQNHIKRLPNYQRQIQDLQAKLDELKNRMDGGWPTMT